MGNGVAPATYPGQALADRVRFRPVVDLDSGSPLAVDIVPPIRSRVVPPHDTAAQAELLSQLARHGTDHGGGLPFLLPVPLRLVVAERQPFEALVGHLRAVGRQPWEVTLVVQGLDVLSPAYTADSALPAPLTHTPHQGLLRGIGFLRGLGFRCAFGTGKVALNLLLDAAPSLFRIDADLVAGLPADERLTALVNGMARFGRTTGSYPLADGVSTVAQVATLRRAGVRLAEGAMFAGDGWRPGDPVAPVPDTSVVATADDEPDAGPRVVDLMVPAASMGEHATSEEVLRAFSTDTSLTCVVLADSRERPVLSIDRTRFLLAVTGPYGHALHAKRPARRLADEPRTVPQEAGATAALRVAGAQRDRVYDDLVVVNEFGQCIGIVRVSDLIRGVT